MPKYISAEEFELLVREQSKFLLIDYDCSLVKVNDWKYFIENGTTRVMYLIEGDALALGIEPIGDGANQLLKQNIIPSSIDVFVISECLDPTLRYSVITIGENWYIHNIQVEIKNRTNLLKKYCQKMLQGDYSQWPDIKKCLSEQRSRLYKKQPTRRLG